MTVGRGLGVSDDEHGGGALQDAAQAAMQRLGIQGRKALVEDDELGLLEQSPGHVESAALAVGKLPAGLADQLPQPRRHAAEEVIKAELAADMFSRLDIRGLQAPHPASQLAMRMASNQPSPPPFRPASSSRHPSSRRRRQTSLDHSPFRTCRSASSNPR